MTGLVRVFAPLVGLALAGCGPGVSDPECWADAGGSLAVPPVAAGETGRLAASLANRCDRQLDVIRVSLTVMRCEGVCPEVTLDPVPAIPLRVAAGGSLELALKAAGGAGPGRTESLLVVTTGELDAPENQVWTTVAETVP